MTTAARPLLTRRALLDAGHTPAELSRRVRSGELVRLAGGVFRTVAETDPIADYRDRVVARALKAPTGVVSHASAAALHGLPLGRSELGAVHLTVPPHWGGRRTSAFVRHAAQLDDGDVIGTDGLRITSVARTLVDLARSTRREAVVMAADHALRDRLTTPAEVLAVLHRGRVRPGTPSARRALAAVDGRSESPGESRLRLMLSPPGWPVPELQTEIRSAAGVFLGRVDLAYVDVATLVEFDGHSKYRVGDRWDSTVLVREKEREDALRSAGFTVVRFVWKELSHPDLVLARVEEAWERGRRMLAAGAVTGTVHVTPPLRIESLARR
ncbi:hypothetical protein [Nakamurella leprariae]|uniref:Transcriptional regulator, AbiEi antitoxin, Type IV TA system n=1 Tax=Nakamurella leprariae TaxID=2803911 RepID=A0A939C0W6_9ACTN|nr:hypothetical protein [Nakamurella leprariae]MBM9466464.1 hypothetical protein [Nakamurella leprariae]